MRLWQSLSFWGIHNHNGLSEKRTVILSNRLSMLIALFTLCIAFSSYIFFGFINSTILAFAAAPFFLLPLFLNYLGLTNASRITLSVILSLASLLVSVMDKFDYIIIEEMQYFEFRITLLATTIFPFILFELREKHLWIPSLSVSFLCILLYDPIHEFFNVGYYQIGFNGPNYYFINSIAVGTFLVIAVSTYFLKFSFEKSEQENVKLITQLSTKQDQLVSANKTIETQREQLALENSQLNSSLFNTNKQLEETNKELINHNNNLQQFSYTVSHNLRGPVASLRGLLSLLHKDELGKRNEEIFQHFENSVVALDDTIKDLNYIIELKNDASSQRETVNLASVLTQIKFLLKKDIDEQRVTITHEFGIVELQSVKAMIQSILYNLISNAIKYRSYERPLVITIRSGILNQQVQLEIQDNGLGIDLPLHKEKLFGLYKRFHTHTEGKGLGLFLVKLQAETLGGYVRVVSKPGIGTTFTVVIEG